MTRRNPCNKGEEYFRRGYQCKGPGWGWDGGRGPVGGTAMAEVAGV